MKTKLKIKYYEKDGPACLYRTRGSGPLFFWCGTAGWSRSAITSLKQALKNKLFKRITQKRAKELEPTVKF